MQKLCLCLSPLFVQSQLTVSGMAYFFDSNTIRRKKFHPIDLLNRILWGPIPCCQVMIQIDLDIRRRSDMFASAQ